MTSSQPRTKRALTFVVVLALASLAGWAWLRSRDAPRNVDWVDGREAIGELLDRGAPADAAEPPSGHPASGERLSAGDPTRLVRLEMDRETASRFFPALGDGRAFEPPLYYRRNRDVERWRSFPEHPEGGWWIRTNSIGMREDVEVQSLRPDLRILVTGDSHTDGVCPNSASFTNRVEAALELGGRHGLVEALNAGVGGYSLYNYLGALEFYRDLAPDVFVAVVYGGNDFSETLALQRYFRGRPRPESRPHSIQRLMRRRGADHGAMFQEMVQAVYFLNNPGDEDVAVRTAGAIALEMERELIDRPTRLVWVYLPPALAGQPRHFASEREAMLGTLDVGPEALEASDRIADRWLAFLERTGIEYVDLRPLFAESPESLYWRTDHHLSVRGHAAVAGALLPVIERLADELRSGRGG